MDRQSITTNFLNNLEKERICENLSQANWAEKLGMSLSSYKRLISGETSKIDLMTAFKMYELTGKMAFELGEQFDSTLDVISKLKKLSPRQLKFIDSIIDFETDFATHIKDDIDDYISVIIPTGDMHDGMIYDSANIEKFNLKNTRIRLNEEIHYGLKVTSNHLHPAYNLDDILLISRCPIRDGDVGIFLNNHTQRVYVRKFHQTAPCLLEPINNYGATFTVDSNNKDDMDKWCKLGKVISKIRL